MIASGPAAISKQVLEGDVCVKVDNQPLAGLTLTSMQEKLMGNPGTEKVLSVLRSRQERIEIEVMLFSTHSAMAARLCQQSHTHAQFMRDLEQGNVVGTMTEIPGWF